MHTFVANLQAIVKVNPILGMSLFNVTEYSICNLVSIN